MSFKPLSDLTAYATPSMSEARAIQAMAGGEATPEQQKRAWNFIVLNICGAARDVIAPGQPDVTAYLAGRRSVALQLGFINTTPAENFRKKGETDA